MKSALVIAEIYGWHVIGRGEWGEVEYPWWGIK